MINYINYFRHRRFFAYKRNGYERYDGVCQKYTDMPSGQNHYNIRSGAVPKSKIDNINKTFDFINDII